MSKFGIVLGEPNSINTEILAKSNIFKKRAIIIGSYDLLKSQLKILKIKRKLKKIKKIEDFRISSKALNILDIPLSFNQPFSVNSK